MPRLPTSLLDLGNILDEARYAHLRKDLLGNGPFFRTVCRASDDLVFAVFVVEDFAPLLGRHGVMLLADSTYKTVPKLPGANQLFSVHPVEFEGESAEVRTDRKA